MKATLFLMLLGLTACGPQVGDCVRALGDKQSGKVTARIASYIEVKYVHKEYSKVYLLVIQRQDDLLVVECPKELQ